MSADEPAGGRQDHPERYRRPSGARARLGVVWRWVKARPEALLMWGNVTPANEVLLQGEAFRAAPRARRRWFAARIIWPTIGTLCLVPAIVTGDAGWVGIIYAVAMCCWWWVLFTATRATVVAHRIAYRSGAAQAINDLIDRVPVQVQDERLPPHPADPPTAPREPAARDR